MSYPSEQSPLARLIAAQHEAPPVSPSISSVLDALIANASRIENRFYRNVEVPLDGYHFVNCGFENCILSTATGSFTIESCVVRNCRALFATGAVRQIKLFSLVQGVGLPNDFMPTIADGTVSIG